MTDDLGRRHRRGLYWIAAFGGALLVALVLGAALHGKHGDRTRGARLLLNQAACSWVTPGENGVPPSRVVVTAWWGPAASGSTVRALRAFAASARPFPSLGTRVAITGGGHAGVCARFGDLQRRAFTAFRALSR